METYEYKILACTDPAVRAAVDRWKLEENLTKWEDERFEMIACRMASDQYAEVFEKTEEYGSENEEIVIDYLMIYRAAREKFKKMYRPGGAVREAPYAYNPKTIPEDH